MRATFCLIAAFNLFAQDLIRQGSQLDLEGKGAEARIAFQQAIDSAPSAAAKANAQRSMAMSWAFEGNCAKTAEYENLVIDYWKTQAQAAPGNAFYQQGEMADEAARVCIDYGNLDAASDLYRKGHDLGLKEPGISPGRKAVWEFRWEHAQARIAARRGNKSEAVKHVAAAAAILFWWMPAVIVCADEPIATSVAPVAADHDDADTACSDHQTTRTRSFAPSTVTVTPA